MREISRCKSVWHTYKFLACTSFSYVCHGLNKVQILHKNEFIIPDVVSWLFASPNIRWRAEGYPGWVDRLTAYIARWFVNSSEVDVTITPNHQHQCSHVMSVCCALFEEVDDVVVSIHRWYSGGKVFHLQSAGLCFNSHLDKPWASCSHLCASVTKQYNLVLVKGQWRSSAGKMTSGLAESNVTLLPGWLKKSPAGWLPVHRDQLRAQRSVMNTGELYLDVSEVVWLMMIVVCVQVLLTDEFIDEMLNDVSDVSDVREVSYTFDHSHGNLHVSAYCIEVSEKSRKLKNGKVGRLSAVAWDKVNSTFPIWHSRDSHL